MEFTEEQIRNMNYDEQYNLAINPNTPVELLAELAKDEKWTVRREVAQNPKTPVGVLKELSIDKEENVRYLVAKNPNSTAQILVSCFDTERKQKKPIRAVFRSISANANCPDYLKAVIQTMLEGM
jgi:hypothetical protein